MILQDQSFCGSQSLDVTCACGGKRALEMPIIWAHMIFKDSSMQYSSTGTTRPCTPYDMILEAQEDPESGFLI